jgi:hypothetical protein
MAKRRTELLRGEDQRLRLLPPLVLLVLLLPSTALATELTDDHECMGRWVGRGRNTGYSTYWTIDLTLTATPSGGRCGTIRYTNPDCHGFLDNCRLEGRDIHTQENYVYRGGCAPPGRVVIRCEQNQMRYSWIGWERVNTILVRPGGGQGGQPPQNTPSPGTNQPAPIPGPGPAPSTTQTPTPLPPPPPMTPPTQPSQPSPSGTSSDSSWFGCSVTSSESKRQGDVVWLVVLFACLLAARRVVHQA